MIRHIRLGNFMYAVIVYRLFCKSSILYIIVQNKYLFCFTYLASVLLKIIKYFEIKLVSFSSSLFQPQQLNFIFFCVAIPIF